MPHIGALSRLSHLISTIGRHVEDLVSGDNRVCSAIEKALFRIVAG
jgi:hypothetical protein